MADAITRQGRFAFGTYIRVKPAVKWSWGIEEATFRDGKLVIKKMRLRAASCLFIWSVALPSTTPTKIGTGIGAGVAICHSSKLRPAARRSFYSQRNRDRSASIAGRSAERVNAWLRG